MDHTDFNLTAGFPTGSLTRRAAMRGITDGLATGLGLVSSFAQDRAAAQTDAATSVATPALRPTLTDAILRAFESDVEAAMQTLRIPGAAVALVQGNEIIFNRGFGVRNAERGEPVTPRTKFRIGSITKSMTSLMLATLVDEGALDWDHRVVHLWPEFQAPTPELTQKLRVRDLLGMGSGIAESDTVSLASLAPAGSGLASATDMARYLTTQMNDGVAPDGTRVASAANITETHRPGVLIGPGQLFPPEAQPDTASLRYAQGWFSETFRDGRQLLWHGGGIEGFDSLTGFVPDEKIGLVILNNSDRGGLFYLSVRASFLSRFFGLNRDLPGFLASVVPVLDAPMAELAAQTRPVDPAAAAYQGLYEDGFRVRLDEVGGLYLDHDIRSMPLWALSDGDYVVTTGPEVVLGQPVTFELNANGVPVMTITGFAPVRWLTGG